MSVVLLGFFIKWLSSRNVELFKWAVLCSLAILTVSVYSRLCHPDIFKIILERISSAFVALINLSHKGTEFLFGNLADDKQSGDIFAVQVLPIIIFLPLFHRYCITRHPSKIVYVFAYLLNKLNISGAESVFYRRQYFLGKRKLR